MTKPSFPAGIGFTAFANSPETYRIKASLDSSVKVALFDAGACLLPVACGASPASITGNTGIDWPSSELPEFSGTFEGTSVAFGKSAAANTKTSKEIEIQLDMVNDQAPTPAPAVFYDAASRLSSGLLQIRAR